MILTNLLDIVVHGGYCYTAQLRYHALGKPDILILLTRFQIFLALIGSSHKSKVFDGGAADGDIGLEVWKLELENHYSIAVFELLVLITAFLRNHKYRES